MSKFDYLIIESVENAFRTSRATPLILGASPSGYGGPPGGFVGYLPQTRVSYDVSESGTLDTPASGMSIKDNLNHIRYRLTTLEAASGAGGGHIIEDNSTTFPQRTYLKFIGSGVIVTDNAGGDSTDITISGGVTSSGNSGHIIKDASTSFAQREGLKFLGNELVITDDAVGNNTVITVSGIGDMLKASYDPDNDGIVDNSEALEGHPASYFQLALGYTPENIGNKSTDVTLASGSDTLYPSQKATKTYVDSRITVLSGLLSTVQIHEDYTSYTNGSKTNFDSLYPIISGSLSLFHEGIREEPVTHYLEDTDHLGFTTLFTPISGSVLVADYLTPASGMPMPIAGTTIIATGIGGGHTIQDEGISLTQRTYLNFTGSPVTVTDDSFNNRTTVTIANTVNGYDGFLVNGKAQGAVAIPLTHLEIQLLTTDNNTPSSSNPVSIVIDGNSLVVQSGISVTLANGTNWFNMGSTELATCEVNLFLYLYKMGTSSNVGLGISRLPYGQTYADFSGTSTSENYFAGSSVPASTDPVRVVGRITAYLTGSSDSYKWHMASGGSFKQVDRPIYETDWLTWTPSYSAASPMTYTSVATYINLYKIRRDTFEVAIHATGTTGGTASKEIWAYLPYSTFRTTSSSIDPILAANVEEASGGPRLGGTAYPIYISSPASIRIGRYDGVNWGLGTYRSIHINGSIPLK